MLNEHSVFSGTDLWKKGIFSLLLVLICTSVWNTDVTFAKAQHVQTAWEWKQTGPEQPKDAEPTHDGGVILLQGDSRNLILTKLDAEGNEEWTKPVTPDLPEISGWERVFSGKFTVEQTPNGGYVIGGASDWYKMTDFFISLTDARGNDISTSILSENRYSELASLRLTEDGGYILVALIEQNMANYGDIKKFTAEGELEWEKQIEVNDMAALPTLQLTEDGGYFIHGISIKDTSNTINHSLVKLDADGQVLWTKTDEVAFPTGSLTIETRNGGLVTAQINGGSIKVDMINKSGSRVWSKEYNDYNALALQDMIMTPEGKIWIGGSVRGKTEGDSDEYLLGLNEQGKKKNEVVLGEQDQNEQLKKIVVFPDQSVALYGIKDERGIITKLR